MGRNSRPLGSFNVFKTFISSNELLDLGYEGLPWTWSNGWEREAEIKERLDRALGIMEWMTLFGNAKLSHVENEASNHCLLLLDINPCFRKRKKEILF